MTETRTAPLDTETAAYLIARIVSASMLVWAQVALSASYPSEATRLLGLVGVAMWGAGSAASVALRLTDAEGTPRRMIAWTWPGDIIALLTLGLAMRFEGDPIYVFFVAMSAVYSAGLDDKRAARALIVLLSITYAITAFFGGQDGLTLAGIPFLLSKVAGLALIGWLFGMMIERADERRRAGPVGARPTAACR